MIGDYGVGGSGQYYQCNPQLTINLEKNDTLSISISFTGTANLYSESKQFTNLTGYPINGHTTNGTLITY